MTHAPIRIRAFLLATFAALLIAPTLTGITAWLIESHHQRATIQRRLDAATAYLTAHRANIDQPQAVHGFAQALQRLHLLAQVVVAGASAKKQIYSSPALGRSQARQSARQAATVAAEISSSWRQKRELVPAPAFGSGATLVADLYYRPASAGTRALAGLLVGVIVLLAALAIAIWFAGRWMVAPLARLSTEVDKVAGGDLTVAVPHSRIAEIANIAQAVEGMSSALGESANRQAEAEDARRFLITGIAHDLRTPLFALRGHLQAIHSRLGDPIAHLQRAEARADALERLIGNLFAYTRDDYTQPALRLEAVPVTELLEDASATLEHASRLANNTIEFGGDPTLAVMVDRDRAKRALINILDNALRYGPQATPIHVGWATAADATVEVTIHDRGPGIDPAILPHIFEPGIRGRDAAETAEDGAGLGLAIAKRAIEQLGGTVTASNDPSGGAVIALTLRRASHRPAFTLDAADNLPVVS